MGDIAMTQVCCESVLQSSTEQWGMHSAQTSAAVHFSWPTAHLHEKQVFTGVTALTQACCESVLQSSTEQWEMHFALISAAVHLS